MKKQNIVFLCEGRAEKALIALLIDNNLLKYSREDLFTEDIFFPYRSFVKFQEDQLEGIQVTDKLIVFKVQDDIPKKMHGKEMVPLKQYREMIDTVNLVLTRPEIEMITIIYFGLEREYAHYEASCKRNSTPKPSSFLKSHNKSFSRCKDYDFVYNLFEDLNRLVYSIKKYHLSDKHKRQVRKHSEILSIYDLLK